MKKENAIIGLLLLLTIVTHFYGEVSALNYNPGVNVGDIIVWKNTVEDEYIKFIQHEITAIWDYNDSETWINVTTSTWEGSNRPDTTPTYLNIHRMFNYS